MIANINSPSVSMNSVSSNDSDQSHVVEPMEMLAMTQVRSQYKHVVLENYQALLWWIFQRGKFLREKATLIKSEILK